VLRLKRVRNPDVVCLERLEHFLRDAEKLGITVLLAGLRSDFLESIERLRFADWYPADRIFPEQDDKDSATLGAVRRVYELLGETNSCPHCAGKTEDARKRLYYLV
jgi:sulfate permease, SulP family